MTSPLGVPDVDCRDYHSLSLNASQLCFFMKTTANCHSDDGFIDYLIFTFCTFDKEIAYIPIIILALWLCILFVSLALVADSFFCPSLRVIADSLKLSQNVAGVTFLAFGNGAPDVFSAIAAIGNSKDGDSGLAFGALFGAAMFITTIIVGVICFIQPFTSVQRPLLRDMIFFTLAAFWAFIVVWDGSIVIWETLGFLFLYVIYIFVVIGGRYANQKIKQKKGIVSNNDFGNKRENTPNLRTDTTIQDSYNGEDDRGDEDEEEIRNITRPLLEDDKNNNDVDEESPLIYSLNGQRPLNVKKSLKASCNPVDRKEWKDSNIINKILILIKTPTLYLLKMTIPLVDYDSDNCNWNKTTMMLNAFIAPMLMTFATKTALKMAGPIPVWCIVLGGVSVPLTLLIFFLTDMNKRPKYHAGFAYLGFAVSIIWIYTIANEIVNILTTFGVILNISNTILGLTLLAWGNSLSDLVADAASARRGYPNMGISACYGGPLFNLLLGIGIPFTLQCIKDGKVLINRSFLQDTLAFFTGVSLISSMFFLVFNKFRFTRAFGIYLICLYMVFLVTCVLIETKIIKDPTA